MWPFLGWGSWTLVTPWPDYPFPLHHLPPFLRTKPLHWPEIEAPQGLFTLAPEEACWGTGRRRSIVPKFPGNRRTQLLSVPRRFMRRRRCRSECGPGLVEAASAPRLIFDFHVIIFFLPLSTQSPERRTKGRRWGMGPPVSGMELVRDRPPRTVCVCGVLQRPRLLSCTGSQEGEG